MANDALYRLYDVALFDLDGVVYAGSTPIEHAAEVIAQISQAGMRAAYVTNNASRTPQDVAAKLGAVGVGADVSDIVTSAQVAAEVLAGRLAPGSPVLVVGDRGLREAVEDVGLKVVNTAAEQPAAVVQGHSTKTGWEQLAEATIAVRGGALWVASNMDATIPTDRGILAGNGSFVRLVAQVLGRKPDAVAGKPQQTMHRASVARTGAERPLVVGDRLDTDIEGAAASDCDSLYVMTGVSRPADVIAAEPLHRPTYVASDLRGMLQAPRSTRRAAEEGRSGRWQATASGVVSTDRTASSDDSADLLALMAGLAWSGAPSRAADAESERVVTSWR